MVPLLGWNSSPVTIYFYPYPELGILIPNLLSLLLSNKKSIFKPVICLSLAVCSGPGENQREETGSRDAGYKTTTTLQPRLVRLSQRENLLQPGAEHQPPGTVVHSLPPL